MKQLAETKIDKKRKKNCEKLGLINTRKISTTPSEICITAAEFKWIRVAFPWTLNLHQVSGAGSAGGA